MGTNKVNNFDITNTQNKTNQLKNGDIAILSSNKRPKSHCCTKVLTLFLIAALSVLCGLISVELNINPKDLVQNILSHELFYTEEALVHDTFNKNKPKEEDTLVKEPIVEHKIKINKVQDQVQPSASVAQKEMDSKKTPKKDPKPNEPELKKIRPDSKTPEKNDPVSSSSSTPPVTKEKTKVESPKPEKTVTRKVEKEIISDASSQDETDEGVNLQELYAEVDSIMSEIVAQDPQNDMVKQLDPHLKEMVIDLENGKYKGIRTQLLHVKLILLELKDRLKGSKKEEVSKEAKEAKPVKPPQKDEKGRVPVDEKVPKPIYIAPRGPKGEGESSKETSQSSDSKPSKAKTDPVSMLAEEQTPTKKVPQPTIETPKSEAQKEKPLKTTKSDEKPSIESTAQSVKTEKKIPEKEKLTEVKKDSKPQQPKKNAPQPEVQKSTPPKKATEIPQSEKQNVSAEKKESKPTTSTKADSTVNREAEAKVESSKKLNTPPTIPKSKPDSSKKEEQDEKLRIAEAVRSQVPDSTS